MIRPTLFDDNLMQCEFCAYYYYVGAPEPPEETLEERLKAIEMTCDECHERVRYIEKDQAFICQNCGLVFTFPVERLY